MKSIAVYCGSSTGNNEIYKNAVLELGKVFIKEEIELVYGAGSVGLMGIIADEVLKGGGRVSGVIPQFLMDLEVGHKGLSNLEITKDMHTRKSRMVDMAEAFVAMPGGFGTMDELFEVLTWGQLDLHSKSIGIYNVNGYFNGILEFMRNAVKEGFLKKRYVDQIVVSSDPNELIEGLKESRLGTLEEGGTGKWV